MIKTTQSKPYINEQLPVKTNCNNLNNYLSHNFIVEVSNFIVNQKDKELIEEKYEQYEVYKWVDGNQYQGQVKNNKRHGMGKLISKNGDVNTGEWVDDQFEEFGIIHKRNGD